MHRIHGSLGIGGLYSVGSGAAPMLNDFQTLGNCISERLEDQEKRCNSPDEETRVYS